MSKSDAGGWKPRHRKNRTIYCSPLCGGDCKRADYDKAVRESAKLAKRLGPGWKPNVWENLGWFWQVENGVMVASERGYLYFNTRPQICVAVVKGDIEAAIATALRIARSNIRQIRNDCAAVDGGIGADD